MKNLSIVLPFPPTVNHYWKVRVVRGKKPFAQFYLSSAAKEYRAAVVAAVRETFGNLEKITGRVGVEIFAYPPTRRALDLDNLPKGVLDSLTHAGIWVDDSQVDRIAVYRKSVVRGGEITVVISVLENGGLFE